MAKDVIDYRTRVRERLDLTALHRTKVLDGSNTTDIVRLDIVAQKLTIEVPSGLTVSVDGSIDGKNFFSIVVGLTADRDTYGDAADEHLVKILKFTRTAGSGQAVVVAV